MSESIAWIITARPERATLLVLIPSIILQIPIEDSITVVPIKGMNWYSQINKAVSLSDSEWLAFPNDDCYLMPSFRSEFSKRFNKADLIYSNIVYDGRGKGPYGLLYSAPKVNYIDKISYVVKRSVFEAVGGFPISDKPEEIYRTDGIFVEKVVAAGYKLERINDFLAVHN